MFEILKRCKQKAFLFLFDAGFYSFSLVEFMIENDLHFIMKVSKTLKLTATSRLSDGSYLATITCKVVESVDPITGRKKWKEKEIQVRVIELQFRGFQPVRLITNIMDSAISAKEIAKHYHVRWDIEISYDEIKTHQCATLRGYQPTIFRSKRSDLVEQELYAILIAYNMVRSTIREATDREGNNPLLISFLETLQIIIEGGPKMSATISKKRKRMELDYMYKMIADSLIDRPRRPRCNPRVVKQKMSNFRKKRKNDKSEIRNFEEDMVILCQKAA